MKKLFMLLVFPLICSCSEFLECKETRLPNERETTWFPNLRDSIVFISNSSTDLVKYTCTNAWFEYETDMCGVVIGYHTFNLLNESNFQIESFSLLSSLKRNEGLTLYYNFFPNNYQLELPVASYSQDIGCVNVSRERPCVSERYGNSFFYHSTKQFNGITYEGVIEMNDYEPNRIPEVDISRFYVNQKGILRIEFYSGEVWDRVF